MKLIMKIHLSMVKKIFMDFAFGFTEIMHDVCVLWGSGIFTSPWALFLLSLLCFLFSFVLCSSDFCNNILFVAGLFFNRSTTRAGACLSNVTECHTISTTKNLVNFSIENRLFSVFPMLCLLFQPLAALYCSIQYFIFFWHLSLAFLVPYLVLSSASLAMHSQTFQASLLSRLWKMSAQSWTRSFFPFCSTFRRTSSLAVPF